MSFIEQLDRYSENKKSSEVWLPVILLSAVVGYALYALTDPYATKFQKTEIAKNRKLNKEIADANRYLDSITINGDKDGKVKALDKTIASKNSQLNDYRHKIAKVEGAVKKLGTILYNNDNWSKFLHGIATKAKNNNLKVYTITNKVYEQNATFGKALDVSIKTEGKYGDLLSFMSDLEQTKLVANISALELKATDKNPIADINLTVWGIKQ